MLHADAEFMLFTAAQINPDFVIVRPLVVERHYFVIGSGIQ